MVTITYYCKEVTSGPFTTNNYYIEVYYHQTKHREIIFSGMYSKGVPALYGIKVIKYLDTLQSCK